MKNLSGKEKNLILRFIRIVTLIFFFLLLSYPMRGQAIIKGTIWDSSSKLPVEDVNVMLQTIDGKGILKYLITVQDGEYEFVYTGPRDSLMVCVTGFNIKAQSKPISARSQIVDFFVVNEAIKIQEVRIKAPEITRRSDTLVYNVASFLDDSDRSISDVIKKMPGIEVKSSGEISYQGKAINKFYIEGLDMLQGRYGIAANNIQAKDIASVQIYENHQPVRALKDVQESDKAALNLKLKDSAKGAFNAVLQAGLGYEPLMWNGEIVPMYFTGKFQTISTYKTNNTGEDVSGELKGHYGSYNNEVSMLAVLSPTPPPFDKRRYLDNNIHTISINAITKLASETTLTANLSYLHDEQSAEGSSMTTYFLPDLPSLSITEITGSSLIRDYTNASFQIESNKNKSFLKEKIYFSGQWDKDRSNVFNTEQDILQDLSNRSIYFNNDFNFIKVFGSNRINFSSNTSYTEKPAELIVTPLLYPEIFENENNSEYSGMFQKVATRRFNSQNSAFTGKSFGKLSVMLSVDANIDIDNTETSLGAILPDMGRTLSPDSMRNDMRYQRLDFKLGPIVSYNGGWLRLSLSLPANFMILDISDRLSYDNNYSFDKLLWTPSMSFTATLNHNFKLSGNSSYYTGYGGATDSYSGFIMTNYRSIGSRKGEPRESRIQNYNLSLNYGNALKLLFGSLDASHWRTSSNLMYGTVFSGNLSWIESYPISNISYGYLFSGRISKRFDEIATTFNLSGQYILSYAEILRQSEIMNTRSDIYNAELNTITRFGRAARFDYGFSWMRSLTSIRNEAAIYEPIDIVKQEAAVTFFITRQLSLRVSGEHYYNSAISKGERNMFFADASLNYTAKRVEYMLEARNLIGTKKYNSASYGDMMSYVYSYGLRPRSIMLKIRFSLK